MMQNRKCGTVRTYRDAGYGFIAPDNGQSNLFFHITEIQDINEQDLVGLRVEFDIEEQANGKHRAIKVRRAEEAQWQ